MKTMENAANKWTDAEYAFAAAFRIIQTVGEQEGTYFGTREDNVTVLRHAAQLELPDAAEELAFLEVQS